jgi:hypothetical protein
MERLRGLQTALRRFKPATGRIPAGLVFVLALAILAFGALSQRERHDAPAVAPLPPEAQALADVTLVDPMALLTLPPDPLRRLEGSAASLSEHGVWLTAEAVVRRCRRPMIMATPRRGMVAKLVYSQPGGVAILTTSAGAPPLALSDKPIPVGGRAFHPGFPRQAPGEFTSRRMGAVQTRGQETDVYAELGRTDGLDGGVGGGAAALGGAPVLDEAGRIVGVSLSQAPRLGRILAVPLARLNAAVAAAHVRPGQNLDERVLTIDNYGLVSDTLRRGSTVAGLVCLDHSLSGMAPGFSALPGSGRQ